jgi:hypothetical protein
MYPEPSAHPPADRSGPTPSPAVRERVLRHCRRAMEERLAGHRRQQRWQWTLAAGTVLLLLFNAVEEHQNNARIAAIEAGHSQVVKAPPPPGAIRSFHARSTLLAALLRDPDAL